jgi:ATP-dependent exoDNAse (exonuclease V) beta subunit
MLLPISQNLTKLGEGAKQTYETYYAQSFMDTLNTLYVGMTRPVEELHIITQKGNIASPPKGLPDIFARIFPELNNQGVIYGTRTKQVPKTSDLIAATTAFTFNLAQATSVVAERSVQSAEALFGTVLHEVMGLVDVPQDLDRALSQSNAKERLGITQYGDLRKNAQEIVAHKHLTAFFDPANIPYKERALFTSKGELLRPDRFVITPEKDVLLLDYKTGKHHESHTIQLQEYASCLAQQGHNVKQKLLVYCGKNLIFKEV